MRAKQAKPALVNGFDRLLTGYSSPDQVNLLNRLELRLDSTHLNSYFNHAKQLSSIAAVVYDPAVLAWSVMVLIAAAFVARYVFRYYLHYNEAAFTDPRQGASNYWVLRGWLLGHITGGMVALLTGPFQFWTGFRTRYAGIHRRMGQLFLSGVAVGSICAFRLGIGTTFGWAAGTWLIALALALSSTSGMAYLAIRKRQVQIHKEWMVRAYVVTFAFVTFRLLNDYSPLANLKPDSDRVNTIGWACWAVPLLVTDVVLQLRRLPRPGKRDS